MPKRSSKKTQRHNDSDDPNVIAFNVVQQATAEGEQDETPRKKNRAAIALGRLGGLKGGKARAEALSAERRSEIARKAAEARWAKEKAEGDT